jgi:hypothetical protein
VDVGRWGCGDGKVQELFGPAADENIGLQIDKLFGEILNSIWVAIAPAIINANIVAILSAELLKAFLQDADPLASISIAFRDRH